MKLLKNRLFIFLLGVIISGSIVYATTYIKASEISYNNTTVESALNDLYDGGVKLTGKLTEVKLGSNQITNNTKKTIYVALFSYTSNTNPSGVVNKRAKIKTVTGATSEEIFYSYNSSSAYGIRIYKLTNCGETVSVVGDTSDGGGQIIFFY